jgi:hypothetical protein
MISAIAVAVIAAALRRTVTRPTSFGNWANSLLRVPWFCVPVSRQVCRFGEEWLIPY